MGFIKQQFMVSYEEYQMILKNKGSLTWEIFSTKTFCKNGWRVTVFWGDDLSVPSWFDKDKFELKLSESKETHVMYAEYWYERICFECSIKNYIDDFGKVPELHFCVDGGDLWAYIDEIILNGSKKELRFMLKDVDG